MNTQTSHERIALYRQRADQARRKAEKFMDDKARDVLFEVADTWDRLADLEARVPQRPN